MPKKAPPRGAVNFMFDCLTGLVVDGVYLYNLNPLDDAIIEQMGVGFFLPYGFVAL